MCGIVGLLDPRRRRDEDTILELLAQMSGRMVHRGPDGSGAWSDPDAGIGFGHRRLAIIDLSPAGHQPMTSADGRYVITYNGEIYNFAELSADLVAAGVTFRGHSDTEVLLEAISRWGLGPTLERCDGMFALALWDREQRTLVLARDRLGEKPLFYGTLGSGEVVFGSSLDSLRHHPDFDRPLDRDALTLYMRHKYVPAPWSIYDGIHKLEPGCWVSIDADGAIGEPVAYWSHLDVVAAATPFTGSDADAIDHLDALLRRSVERRLVADVPVGAFLSGGIDSSTIVGVAQAVTSGPLRTFTIGTTSADFDESDAARAVARHLGTDHHEQTVEPRDALDVIPLMGSIYDEPFGDSSQVPTYIVSRLARRHVTVALSGDAGDELFGGYNRYTSVPGLWRRAESLPPRVRHAGAAVLGAVPPRAWDTAALALPRRRRPQQVGLKVSKALDVVGAASPHDAFHRLVSHWQEPERLVRGGHEPPTLHTSSDRWPATADIVDHMMAIDTVTYLPDDILTKVDRATMAVSLEGRIPLLDRDIVEFAASLPMHLRIRNGTSKWLLRQVLDRYVPTHLVDRPKSGFGLPIGAWLRSDLRDWAQDLLFGPESADHLDQQVLRSAWKRHQSGREDLAYPLWDVLMFTAWAREAVPSSLSSR